MNTQTLALIAAAGGVIVLAYALGTSRKLSKPEFSGLITGAVGLWLTASLLAGQGLTAQVAIQSALLTICGVIWARDLRAVVREARAS